jgi:hypothetical protein
VGKDKTHTDSETTEENADIFFLHKDTYDVREQAPVLPQEGVQGQPMGQSDTSVHQQRGWQFWWVYFESTCTLRGVNVGTTDEWEVSINSVMNGKQQKWHTTYKWRLNYIQYLILYFVAFITSLAEKTNQYYQQYFLMTNLQYLIESEMFVSLVIAVQMGHEIWDNLEDYWWTT